MVQINLGGKVQVHVTTWFVFVSTQRSNVKCTPWLDLPVLHAVKLSLLEDLSVVGSGGGHLVPNPNEKEKAKEIHSFACISQAHQAN